MNEKENMLDAATEIAPILNLDAKNNDWALPLRTGARTRAVVATALTANHRLKSQYNQVVIKLYKGDGKSNGSREYQDYHQDHFHRIPELIFNRFVQKSIEGGLYKGVGPYSIVEYIAGDELADLLDMKRLSPQRARQILHDILFEIWIPLWGTGLRFKDCHPGNFICSTSGPTIMIDTEQMRKGARELLTNSESWTQRKKHEESGLKRLPGLVARIVMATNLGVPKARVLRQIKETIAESGLDYSLARLGRHERGVESALKSATRFMTDIEKRGFIS